MDGWARIGQAVSVEHIFTIDEACRLLPQVLSRADELVRGRADLVELRQALSDGSPPPLGGLAEAKALEARMSELLGWFPASGIDLKGLAPLLIDFPAVLDGEHAALLAGRRVPARLVSQGRPRIRRPATDSRVFPRFFPGLPLAMPSFYLENHFKPGHNAPEQARGTAVDGPGWRNKCRYARLVPVCACTPIRRPGP